MLFMFVILAEVVARMVFRSGLLELVQKLRSLFKGKDE
jgi:hypothetical protein